MKLLITLLVLIASVFVFSIGLVDSQQDEYIADLNIREPRIYEDKIRTMIEGLMQKLRDTGFDPLTGDHNITAPKMGINKLILKNANIKGLTQFVIKDLGLSLVGLKFHYGLQWDNKIDIETEYDLDANIGGMHLFGAGHLKLKLDYFNINGDKCKIGSDENKFLFLEQFSIYFDIDPAKAEFSISGFMNDDYLSGLLTEVLIPSLDELLADQTFKDKLSDNLGGQVMKLFKELVVNKTLSDLMGKNIYFINDNING